MELISVSLRGFIKPGWLEELFIIIIFENDSESHGTSLYLVYNNHYFKIRNIQRAIACNYKSNTSVLF